MQGPEGSPGVYNPNLDEPGHVGVTGPQGPIGSKGDMGLSGVPGGPGLGGYIGSPGEPGTAGQPGPPGPRGTSIKGEQGNDGEQTLLFHFTYFIYCLVLVNVSLNQWCPTFNLPRANLEFKPFWRATIIYSTLNILNFYYF